MSDKCWEVNRCGKNEDERNSSDSCPCPFSFKYNGSPNGINNGRCCMTTNTKNDPTSDIHFTQLADRMKDQVRCAFFQRVKDLNSEES